MKNCQLTSKCAKGLFFFFLNYQQLKNRNNSKSFSIDLTSTQRTRMRFAPLIRTSILAQVFIARSAVKRSPQSFFFFNYYSKSVESIESATAFEHRARRHGLPRQLVVRSVVFNSIAVCADRIHFAEPRSNIIAFVFLNCRVSPNTQFFSVQVSRSLKRIRNIFLRQPWDAITRATVSTGHSSYNIPVVELIIPTVPERCQRIKSIGKSKSTID